MSDINTLIEQIKQEAEQSDFPLDTLVYQEADLPPTQPILYTGNLKSQLCIFGRDLGRDEVFARQPLYGAAGTLVRQGFYTAIHRENTTDKKLLETICDRLLLTNTVPYKPPENKAYSQKVKKRFRPFIERFLVLYWQGHQIITLGTEAFTWFTIYDQDNIKNFWQRGDRYQAKIEINLTAIDENGKKHEKLITLLPLPHPSPLNIKYYSKFPQMLQQRISQLDF
jgi:uracil-DNA glycosylase